MSSLMGWCIDRNHDECRIEYITWSGLGEYRRCGCTCHPSVDDAHIAEYVAAHKTGDLPRDNSSTRVRRRKTKIVDRAPVRKTTRNVEAEAEALAATDAALADIESDESVRERMAELMEGE